ncbi:MAG: histidine phosphatase family protein, partial [Planctomycetota bacterium]
IFELDLDDPIHSPFCHKYLAFWNEMERVCKGMTYEGRPVRLEPALRELDFGHWEGVAWTAVPRREWQPWAADWVHTATPGGESLEQLARRCATCLRGLLWRYRACPRLIIITHAGVIRSLYAHLTDTPLERVWDLHVPLGGICRLRRVAPAWQLRQFALRESLD